MGDEEQSSVDVGDLRAVVEEAVLALSGVTIEDLRIPLPGALKDLAKASALVSGVVEDRIPDLLNSVRASTWDESGDLRDYEFRKFDIGFPDILLVRRSDPTDVLFEIEAKSWYILAGDPLTARFLTSAAEINEGTLVIIVAWMFDGVVNGSPRLMRIHVEDALHLAKHRDAAWVGSEPQLRRVVDPPNAPDVSRNLRRTQARGEYRETANDDWRKDSDNFGKLERIQDPALREFRDATFAIRAAGKSLNEWRLFIKKNSTGE